MASSRMRPMFKRVHSVYSWLWTPERRWLLFLAMAFVALGTFVEISDELIEDKELSALDGRILRYVATLRRPWLTIPVIDLTGLGSVTLLGLVTTITCVVLLNLRDLRGASQMIVAMAGATLWVFLTKRWFARARPDVVDHLLQVHSFSFPSGHAAGSAALYVTFAVVVGRHLRTLRARIWLLASTATLAVAIGLSRIYLGVHYPSDVASGLVFGSGWALLVSAAFEWRRITGDARTEEAG
jgi:undecaprenyl-diphosphatase